MLKSSKILTLIFKFKFSFKVIAIPFVTAGRGVHLTSGAVYVIVQRSASLDNDVYGTAGSQLKPHCNVQVGEKGLHGHACQLSLAAVNGIMGKTVKAHFMSVSKMVTAGFR